VRLANPPHLRRRLALDCLATQAVRLEGQPVHWRPAPDRHCWLAECGSWLATHIGVALWRHRALLMVKRHA
jgi:hypothetical protein